MKRLKLYYSKALINSLKKYIVRYLLQSHLNGR
jgi:hypothetical protein